MPRYCLRDYLEKQCKPENHLAYKSVLPIYSLEETEFLGAATRKGVEFFDFKNGSFRSENCAFSSISATPEHSSCNSKESKNTQT
jgi:hypothetical protein